MMKKFLILKLEGPMQAWGGHTFEDYRPSEIFPTRSGVVGLIGGCLGIDRNDSRRLTDLSGSFFFAARCDNRPFQVYKLTDFHTVMNARRVGGSDGKFPVVSRREYLCDACFTLALGFLDDAPFSIEDVARAVRHPYYTPFLGRRCCPLGRPLYEDEVLASDLLAALKRIPPFSGTVYCENLKSMNRMVVRDVPMPGASRRFATREVYIHQQEVEDVSE